MSRFKHSGEREKQLREKKGRAFRNKMIKTSEEQLGRSLTAKEMQEVCEQADQVIPNLPIYGDE